MGSHSKSGQHINKNTQDDLFYLEHGFTRIPTLVQWMATLRCNLSCPHCLAVSRESGFEDMPFAKVCNLIDQVADLGVDEFLVTGGEPLLREDLPDIIRYLGKRKVNWSFNTATRPNAEQRKSIAANPPVFAAVSIDGPAKVHDAFRGRIGALNEALESITFFSGLKGCSVTAGTTVTSKNFSHLGKTFPIVAASGADSWGFHLLVPEGRVSENRDLFLSHRQHKSLLKYITRLRSYFPVQLADEVGYCGSIEPLVRDYPWECGAGKAQCVVLPDGEVVPCNTLDRSTSAGNIHNTSLAAIWQNGFDELRNWKAEGKCSRCVFVKVCKGGCWLQRRRDLQCFKEVWQVPDFIKTAAGIAICFGLMTQPPASAGNSPEEIAAVESSTVQPMTARDKIKVNTFIRRETGGGLEGKILRFYIHSLPNDSPALSKIYLDRLPITTDPDISDDPGNQFFNAFVNKTLARDLPGRCQAVKNALKTKQYSLSLAAILWRSLAEPMLFDSDHFTRSPEHQKLMTETLTLLATATEKWRMQIYSEKLDPYLARGRQSFRYSFMMAKSITPSPASLQLAKDTAVERWEKNERNSGITKDYLAEHPFAADMRLVVQTKENSGINILGSKNRALRENETLGIFDVIQIKNDISTSQIKIGWIGTNETLTIQLPAGEWSYADLVAAAYHQNPKQYTWTTERLQRYTLFNQINPMDAPMVLDKVNSQGQKHKKDDNIDIKAIYWMADFWMF